MRILILDKEEVTIRDYLDKAGFNWKTGTIVYQNNTVGYPGLGGSFSLETPTVISPNDKILDKTFKYNYIYPMFPRIFAKDEEAIYVPAFYNRCVWLEKIPTSWLYYTAGNNTPYIGDCG